jgi:hypothetical protein
VTVDDPAVPNCGSEAEREPCTERDARCETLECDVELVCTDTDPTNGGQCPESRARVKRDIAYVSDADRRALHDAVVHLPLASYRYKIDPEGASHLGFIIDDIEPSPAARGDRVDLYGYLSMAVAAIQVQQQELDSLRSELQALRDQSTAVCE